MARRSAAAVAVANIPAAANGGLEAAITQAALDLFVARGFHGTSARDIADRAGTSVSHLYYYYPSKGHVLTSLILGIVGDLLAALEPVAAPSGASPPERLRGIVEAHVLFHLRRRGEAFIGRSELRSLRDEDRSAVIAQYDRVTAIFRAAIRDGIAAGTFACPYPSEATSALVTMCYGVANWYRPDGALGPQQIAERYAALALQMVGCTAEG